MSASDDAEASMISKLKQACGFEYTSKLQRMFQVYFLMCTVCLCVLINIRFQFVIGVVMRNVEKISWYVHCVIYNMLRIIDHYIVLFALEVLLSCLALNSFSIKFFMCSVL